MPQDRLAEFRGCRGLPIDTEAWKRAIAYAPGEIDYEQPAVQIIRLTPKTARYLYSAYTPTVARYERGTRPVLERFAAVAVGNARTAREKALRLLERTWRRVVWPHGIPDRLREVGGTEEDILERGYGYCNEASRVFVSLCQVAGIPARMTFHWTLDGRYGHSLAEAWFEGRWNLCDSDINVSGLAIEGLRANCWELMSRPEVAQAFDQIVTRPMLAVIGVAATDSHRYSDFFRLVGICNYPIESFPFKRRAGASKGAYA